MTTSSLGLIAGLLLGVAAAAGGFTGFLIALILGAAGYLIGGQRDGEFDLSTLLRARPWITTMTATLHGTPPVLTAAPRRSR